MPRVSLHRWISLQVRPYAMGASYKFQKYRLFIDVFILRLRSCFRCQWVWVVSAGSE